MMLLQTNSYIVPKDKRAQHARLVQRFRQCLTRLGCDHFEAYEQVGANWSPADTTGRFVQLMRFRDRKHQLAVQAAERNDPAAQSLIKEFCELINFPYQQQQGLFAVGFYHSLLPTLTQRNTPGTDEEHYEQEEGADEPVIPMSAEPGFPPAVPTVAQVEPEPQVGEEITGEEVSAEDELIVEDTHQDPDAAALDHLSLDDLGSEEDSHMRLVSDEDEFKSDDHIKAEGQH